jgi:hypothetical protein
MEWVYGMILQNTVETLKKLNFEVLEHPLYSLDLTPLDSTVWSNQTSLKRPSVYHRLATGCNAACVACLSAQNFLIWRNNAYCAVMDKVHFKQGDYVEKLCNCKISTLVFINMKHTLHIIIDSPSTHKVHHTHPNFISPTALSSAQTTKNLSNILHCCFTHPWLKFFTES